MALAATKAAWQAYKTIGGALDTISDGYTYAAKALSISLGAQDPLKNTGVAEKILKKVATGQKVYGYVRKIVDLADETKRQGTALKLGIKISMDIAAKLLGTSLTTHPYYAYHKAQIDALADALNANRNSREAVDAYRRAVAAANSTAVNAEFARLESRKVDIVVQHFDFRDSIGVAADIARGTISDDLARKKIAQYGNGRLSQAVADLETWRANWAELSFDVMQLQIMTGDELNVAIEAMNEVKDLIATLMGGSNTNRVSGQAAVNNIEWEKYDQIVGQKSPSRLMMDPVKFAQGNTDKAAAWAQALTQMCDFVRSEDVVFPSKFNLELEKLNRVLYGN